MAACHTLSGVTVLLPCFNEADNVEAAVAEAVGAAASAAERFQVVVVDDGSDDGTADIARGATLVEVDVAHRPRRAGAQTGASPRVIARALNELRTLRLSH